jgi:hypothetical protein
MPSADTLTLLPAPSTPSRPEHAPHLFALLALIVEASRKADHWATQRNDLTAPLTSLHGLGKIGAYLEHRGWVIAYSPGPLDYDYPPDVVELEAQLEEAKAAAVATKRAILKPSTPFWSVRKPRPANAGQEAA